MNARVVLIIVGTLVVVTVTAGIIVMTGKVVTQKITNPLVGQWQLVDRNVCSFSYPGQVEFFEDSVYTASGASLWWQGGAYKVVDGGRIRLDTTSGPTLYGMRVEGTRLFVTNTHGCTLIYLRMKGPT